MGQADRVVQSLPFMFFNFRERGEVMKSLVEKAEVLIEALPYIRRFFGKTIVIKYGGHAMLEPELRESFARDVVLLKYVGLKPVVVHGGGPQIASQLDRIGKKAEFVDGLRVTDDETMEVVEMVLGGTVNREIVGLVQQAGGRAAGLTGCDGSLLRVEKKFKNGRDIGRVGHVVDVDPTALQAVSEGGFVPVIAPIGLDEAGQTYNVNADEAAGVSEDVRQVVYGEIVALRACGEVGGEVLNALEARGSGLQETLRNSQQGEEDGSAEESDE